MKKNRFIYWLFSIIASLICILFTFIDPENYMLYVIIVFCLIIPNFTLRKLERRELINIMYKYSNNCDPYEYLYNIQEFHSKCLSSKKTKEYNRITYALIYLDCGSDENALEILLSLVDSEKKMNDYVLLWYYRAWIIYYFNNREPDKIKVLLDEIKSIISRVPNKFKSNYETAYNLMLEKYNIAAGIHLETTKEFYQSYINNKPSMLIYLSCLYNIALIDLQRREYFKAKDNFDIIVKSGRKLGLVDKSKAYLDKINSLLNNIN